MRLKKIIFALYLILLARNVFGQKPGTNAHIFNVTPTSTRSAVGFVNYEDLQASPYIGGWIAPNTWAANNLFWIFPVNDFEGCMTSNGSKATSWSNCAHVVAKNLDCVAASGSGTHYTCSTENSFTPTAGDIIIFKFDVVNGANSDLAVNGATAYPIVNNLTLVAMPTTTAAIGTESVMMFDGSHWQMNIGSSGSSSSHNFTCGVSGSTVVTTGDLKLYPTAKDGGTINRVDISGCALSGASCTTGSITVDIWKHAAGTIPTSADKISASAPATLSSSQLSQNGSLSGWNTTVTAGDVFGCSVATITGITSFTVQVWW